MIFKIRLRNTIIIALMFVLGLLFYVTMEILANRQSILFMFRYTNSTNDFSLKVTIIIV